MTNPQQRPQSDGASSQYLSSLRSSLDRDIGAVLNTSLAERPAAPPPSPAGVSPGGGRAPLWGPSSPDALRSQPNLASFLSAVDSAYALQRQVEILYESITGEGLPLRQRQGVKLQSGLIPALLQLVSEIESAHAVTAGILADLRGRL